MINMLLSEAAESLQVTLIGDDARFVGCSTDSRTVKSGQMFIALRGDHFDGHDYLGEAQKSGAVAALVENGAEQVLPLLVVNDSRKAMGLLGQQWRDNFKIPLIAVTGSNGKTTVKEMLSSILGLQEPVLVTHGNLNNDIGVPLTLFSLEEQHRYAVIEMGANHPGEIRWLSKLASPTVAVITQCAPAHLEGFETVDGVAHAKAEIFEGLLASGIAIINADDQYAHLWREKASAFKQFCFGLNNNADVFATEISVDEQTAHSKFRITTPAGTIRLALPLPGHHNIKNALAATACCLAVNIPLKTIKAGLERMQAVKGRLQMKQGINGARIYDDSYNANPASLDAALQVLSAQPKHRWLILGDMGELGSSTRLLHEKAGEAARVAGIDKLYTLGELSRYAAESFGKGAQHFTEVDSLIESLRKDLNEGVTILVKGSRTMAMERIVNPLVKVNT